MNNSGRCFAALSFLVPVGMSALLGASFVKSATADPVAIAQLPGVVPITLPNATRLTLPVPKNNLKPVPFQSGTLLKGWVIEIPGNRPICTPAYYDGKLYVGGGYGSHEFYAFDAKTGQLAWQYNTSDDGPTAAVVEDGCVAFNTESCTVYVLDAKTGKELWKQWLGDPLMSQPAIAKGKLFMAYPSGQRGQGEGGHALLCADLHTGTHLWTQQISSDVISAPIVEYDRVYVACMDGTTYSFSTKDGALIWKKQGQATSAPVVHDGKMIMAERSGAGNSVNEGMRRIDAKSGKAQDKELLAYAPAPYISGATNGTIGPQGGDANYISGVNLAGKPQPKGSFANAKKAWYQSMDSSVGFATAPASANLSRAEQNLGISSVAGAWGYQGARATYRNGTVTNTQLTYVNCVDAETGKVKWRAEAKAPFVTGQSQVFSTPALGRENMYLCSGDGHLVCMNQQTGAVKYMYATNKPISFQPALAGGNIYIGTGNGQLLCIAANDPDADGWTAWGGNAQHNKTE